MISLPGVERSSLAVITRRGGTVPSSRIYRVPLAQQFRSFRVLRWCSRPGNENMPCDGTPPGPGRPTAAGAGSVAIAMATDPAAQGPPRVSRRQRTEGIDFSPSAPGPPSGICCDLRSCPCASPGLPIRHHLRGCAPVPGIAGNTNRHLASVHSFSRVRGSYRGHCPGPDNVGPAPRHHRRANRRAHH